MAKATKTTKIVTANVMRLVTTQEWRSVPQEIIEDRVLLDLSQKEALYLMDLTGKIAGGDNTRGVHNQSINKGLSDVLPQRVYSGIGENIARDIVPEKWTGRPGEHLHVLTLIEHGIPEGSL